MKKFLFLSLFVIASVIVNAQPGGPGNEDPGGPQSGGVPLDAGLTVLLAAGAGYGAKKAYDYRKKSKKDKESGSPKE